LANFPFFFPSAGAASALPVALPLLQQLPADVVPEADELLQDLPSAELVADALEAQQLPPFASFEAEQDAFSVFAFSSFVLEVVCALAATPTKATVR